MVWVNKVQLCFINYCVQTDTLHYVPPYFPFYIVLQQHNQNKILYICSHLKTASLCTKTTIKSVSAPLHALGEGGRQKGKAGGEGEVVEKEEAEVVRRKGEAGDEGKVAPTLGIAVGAGKSSAAERGKTEEGGSGGRGSGEAEGGRGFWRAGGCTGDGGTGGEGETGSC